MLDFLKNLFRRPLNAENALELSEHNAAKIRQKQYIKCRKRLESAIQEAISDGEEQCCIYEYDENFDSLVFEELKREFTARGFRLELNGGDFIFCYWSKENDMENPPKERPN